MTDNEARGRILQKIYELRNTAPRIDIKELNGLGIDSGALGRYLLQLHQMGLIDGLLHPSSRDPHGSIDAGIIQITAEGSNAVENPNTAPPQVTIDRSIHIHGSQHIQVGDGNIQGINIDIEKLNAAIDHSQANFTEKQEAKSLVSKIVGNKLVMAVLASVFTAIPTSTE